MKLEINIPDLEWDEFTDRHYSINSNVAGLNANYKICFLQTKDQKMQFSLYREDYNKPFGLAFNETLEECKRRAQKDYENIAWLYLSQKANFFVYATERKSNG